MLLGFSEIMKDSGKAPANKPAEFKVTHQLGKQAKATAQDPPAPKKWKKPPAIDPAQARSAPIPATKNPRLSDRWKVGRGLQIDNLSADYVYGHHDRKPYTTDSDGLFGQSNVRVDLLQLRQGHLVGRDKDTHSIMIEIRNIGVPTPRVLPLVYHLITKPGVAIIDAGVYEPAEIKRSITALKKLTEVARLRPQKCAKFNLIYGSQNPLIGLKYEFIPYSDAQDLVNMLDIIAGNIRAGGVNAGPLKLKRQAIIEELGKIGVLDHKAVKELLG